MIEIANHGPLIIGTNFWDSDLARGGKVFVSVNAGAIRVLLPPAAYGWLSDMRMARECVLSRGPVTGDTYRVGLAGSRSQTVRVLESPVFGIFLAPDEPREEADICLPYPASGSVGQTHALHIRHAPEAIEIMWDDGSDSPFTLHLTPESFDQLPAAPEPGREWVLAVYVAKDGRPHKSMERVCHWRRVPEIPYLKPWGE